MMKRKNKDLDQKVESYINNLFTSVRESQQLIELKEELTVNLKEKIKDFKEDGIDDEEAFKAGVSSLGDLSELIEDMRRIGQNNPKQYVNNSKNNMMSKLGFLIGILTIVFGALFSLMIYFLDLPNETISAPTILIGIGVVIINYSFLTRETAKKFPMNKVYALLYSLSIGLIIFSVYVGVVSYIVTDEMFIALATATLFFIIGLTGYLSLLFSVKRRRKY